MLMPRGWLCLGAITMLGMFHVVYIYGFDEKTYYVLNAYPGWGRNYVGKIPGSDIVRFYLVKPTYPRPAEGGAEHLL